MKKAVTLLFVFCMAFNFIGSGPQSAGAAEKTFTWVVSGLSNPTSMDEVAFTTLRDKLPELSKGRIKVTFHPGGTLYSNDRDAWELIQDGAVTIGRCSQLTGVTDYWEAFSLPFFWKKEDINKAVNSKEFNDLLKPKYDDAGVKYLGAWVVPRQLYSKKAVKNLADLQGLKIRTKKTKSAMDAFLALGAIPTPLPWGEVPSALKTGLVDGAEGTATSYWSDSFYEFDPFLSLIDYQWTANAMHMNKAAYDALPPDLQTAVDQAVAEAIVAVNKAYDDLFKGLYTKLEGKGVTITYNNQIMDMPEWRQKVADAGIVKQVLSTVPNFQVVIDKYVTN